MKKNFFTGKKIFISGGAGVIGTQLVQLLHSQGAKLFVGDLKPRPEEWAGDIRYRQGDLNFITKKELDDFGPQIFFHLAATFERSTENYEFWDEQWQNNTVLSHYLISLLRDSSVLKSVIFPSSYLIYDKVLYSYAKARGTASRLRESDPVSPRNLTGSSKFNHEVELEFLRHFKKFQVVCARIYRSYGKDSRDIVSRFVRLLLENKPIDVFHDENIFDYIYAGDVADGLMRLAETKWSGVVNLGTGHSCRVAEVVNILRKHFPDMKIRKVKTLDVFEASEADTTLLEKVTGWTPPTSLEKGIAQIISFERARRAKKKIIPKNVLITSISKKVPLIKSVRQAICKIGNGVKLYGGDFDKNSIGKYFVDQFWHMPKTTNENLKEIIGFCTNHNIGYIVPTRDGELAFWSENEEEFKSRGISVMVSGVHAIQTSIDKLKFYQWAARAGFPVIKTGETVNGVRATRYVVKERFGAGSGGVGINLTKAQALEYSKKLKNPISQPFVSGREYSIDVYVDRKGKAKGVLVRERNVVVDGESQVTTIVKKEKAERIIGSMAEKLKLRGHSVFQVLIDSKGGIHIIECNARFGGASSSSIVAGLDSFYWFLLESQNNDISSYPFIPHAGKLTMVRFKEDIFI